MVEGAARGTREDDGAEEPRGAPPRPSRAPRGAPPRKGLPPAKPSSAAAPSLPPRSGVLVDTARAAAAFLLGRTCPKYTKSASAASSPTTPATEPAMVAVSLSLAAAAAPAPAPGSGPPAGRDGEGVREGGAPTIAVLAANCGTPTMYVPAPPLVSAPTPVITVPSSTPGPVTGEPTASGGPPNAAVTVSVAPEMAPENEVPAAVVVEKSGTVCRTPTVYVPAPPLLAPTKPVTTVPGSTPAPDRGMPTANVPNVTDVRVRVDPEMEPTNATEPAVKKGAAAVTEGAAEGVSALESAEEGVADVEVEAEWKADGDAVPVAERRGDAVPVPERERGGEAVKGADFVPAMEALVEEEPVTEAERLADALAEGVGESVSHERVGVALTEADPVGDVDAVSAALSVL